MLHQFRCDIVSIRRNAFMNAAADLYNGLNTVDDILRLIGQEESLFLEVKRGTVPMSQDDKQHLAIALSGFANSSGGVLIFGLLAQKGTEDEPDLISKVEPIKDIDRFLPEVQSLIGKAVVPIVDGATAKPVQYEKDPILGFYVVLIPESDRGPHRAILKGTRQYYKRSGDSFYVMEHFDLADMFGKRRRPDLHFIWRLGQISFDYDKPYKFAIILGLENLGRGLARYPFFGIHRLLGGVLCEYGVDGLKRQGLPILMSDVTQNIKFAGSINNVIHPSTIMEVTALGLFNVNSLPDIRFNLTVAAEDLEAKTKEVEIRAETVRAVLADSAKREEWVRVS